MPAWIPEAEKPVQSSEPIGRRLFDQPRLVGASDQRPLKGFLDLRDFEEKRDPGDVSLDRLGRTGVDKVVFRFLRDKAERAAERFTKPKKFHGWAVLRAKQLTGAIAGAPKFPLVPSPEIPHDPSHIDHNPYHAHVCRPTGHEKDSFFTALCLKHIFEQHSEFLRSRPIGFWDWLYGTYRWLLWRFR